MTLRRTATSDAVPRLAAHRKLKLDPVRGSQTIQAPERVFVLDETAYAVVSRCDGNTSVAAIVDALCQVYEDAPRAEVETDVIALIQDFLDKGVMEL